VAIADVNVNVSPFRKQGEDLMAVDQGRTVVTPIGLPVRKPEPPLGF
jgi:hypothetical protein